MSDATARTMASQYLVITGNYWAFTLTDGALRMLVVLHFHQLGYSPLQVAMLFLFYEVFGVVTNLVGGWLGGKMVYELRAGVVEPADLVPRVRV